MAQAKRTWTETVGPYTGKSKSELEQEYIANQREEGKIPQAKKK